jgi:outer membrane protein
MSVDWLKACLAIMGAVTVGCVHSAEWSAYPLEDPLRTRPDVLSSGIVLPGDGQTWSCGSGYGPIQLDFKEPLALNVAVDMALCHNSQVKNTWAAIKVQAAALGEARGAYLPTLNATTSKLHNKNVDLAGQIPDTSSRGRTKNYSLTYRLLDFGARSANLEAANQTLMAALASHDAALQKVLASVIGGYFDAMTAQAAYVSRAQALELARSTVQASERREKLGVAALSDTLQAQTALAKARLALHRAQGDKQKAVAVLMYAMGLQPTKAGLLLPTEHDVPQTQYVSDLTDWLQEAQTKHPAIASARAQWLVAQAKVKATQAAGLPTLDYNHNYYENGYPNQGLNALGTGVTTAGFVLTVPLFDGFASTYRVRGAQAQVEQSQAQLEDTEQQILMEVVKAHADAMASLENLQSSENLLTAARAAVVSSQKRYEKGAADVLELLSTQSALADAEQERVRCLADWRSARLKLIASVGSLGRSGLD